ncbi:uncharacterized protein LOC111114980 isoform X1 [Crassostrea virginica]
MTLRSSAGASATQEEKFLIPKNMDSSCEGKIKTQDLSCEYKELATLKKTHQKTFTQDGTVISKNKPCDLCGNFDNVNHHCIECNQDLCNWCKHLHLTSQVSFKHHPILIRLWERNAEDLRCPLHHGNFMTVYCIHCRKMVCEMCSKDSTTVDPRPCFLWNAKSEMMHRMNLYKQGKITLKGMSFAECHLLEECLIEDKFNQMAAVDRIQEELAEQIEEDRNIIEGYQEKFEAWYQQICEEFAAKIKKYTKKAEKYRGKELIRLYKYAENDINRPRENVQPIYNIPPPEFIPGKPGEFPIVKENFGKLVFCDLHMQWTKHIQVYNQLSIY